MSERLLDEFAIRLLETGIAPAFAVAVTDRDRIRTSKTYGAASPESLWAIGSIGKSVTAVLALQLAEERMLDLHAPVTDYVEWMTMPGGFAPITLHHLLSHTSGVIADSDRAPASTFDVIALRDIAPGFAPGEHFHYSNVGYRAVGVVLERVTGRSYAELVQGRVLDRLGMRASVPVMVHETRRRMPGGHVPYYDDRPWEPAHGLVPGPWVESAEADGCLCCSPEDLATYLRALWTGEGLLSASNVALMRAAHARSDAGDEQYGYGLELDGDGFGHGGDMLGYVAHMRADTETGLGVVALANGIGGARALGEAALEIAQGRTPPDPEFPPDPVLRDDGSGPAAWRPYVGRYRAHNPWLPTFSIAACSGTLVLGTDWLDGSEQIPLVAIGEHAFRVGDPEWSPERLSFDTVLDDRAQRAIYSGTPYFRAFTT
jgi:CubicO group peptidase (beta-lactamase class C family)